MRIYVDGSYNLTDKTYGAGCVILNDKESQVIDILSYKGDDEEWIKERQIGGEIKATLDAVEYAIKEGQSKITILFDYLGIRDWAEGNWKRNGVVSKYYYSEMQKLMKQIKIEFIKVDAHSDNYYNEAVDGVAKEACGVKVPKKTKIILDEVKKKMNEKFNVIQWNGYRGIELFNCDEKDLKLCIEVEKSIKKQLLNERLSEQGELPNGVLCEVIVLKEPLSRKEIKTLEVKGAFKSPRVTDNCSIVTLENDSAIKFRTEYINKDSFDKKNYEYAEFFNSGTKSSKHYNINSIDRDDLEEKLLNLIYVTSKIKGLSFDLSIGAHVEGIENGEIELTLERLQGRKIIVNDDFLFELILENIDFIITQTNYNLCYKGTSIQQVTAGVSNLDELKSIFESIDYNSEIDPDLLRLLLNMNIDKEVEF